MKNKVKIASLLLAIAGLSGCEINDPVNDWATWDNKPHTFIGS